MRDYKPIEDYGIIGNLDTCALVGKDGSIDWCCFPHIESPSVFAAILDIEKGGHFSVRPSGDYESRQEYIENTNILQTTFKTPSGKATIIDFMPMKKDQEANTHETQAIFRKVICDEGTMELEVSFKPRFDYVRAETVVEEAKNGILARGDGEFLSLKSPVEMVIEKGEASGVHTLKNREELWLALHHSSEAAMDQYMCECAFDETKEYWENWVSTCGSQACGFYGKWHEEIVRSSLVLKLLTHHETGAICAAPTTSLPEVIGGERNWDYRYTWIRDSSFTVQALRNLGHVEDAKNFLQWFMGICRVRHDPGDIQIMYGLHGEMDLEETELSHLTGYKDSRPVRVGNKAAKQKQLDIYGELLNAFYEMVQRGEEVPREEKKLDYDAPFNTWEDVKDEIRSAILKKGFNKKLNSFVQAFGSEVLDATSLLIPIMGLLPFDDARVQGTVDATLDNLMAGNGLVYRYKGEDGLGGEEGAFLLCSFWLVDVLALSGRFQEAEKLLNDVMRYKSPLGLFAEEVEPRTGRLLGNFPQAFSHIGLVNSALYLGKARGLEHVGPELLGHGEK
jgi:GH15 family glucan-1,4-alpha-glucosidase